MGIKAVSEFTILAWRHFNGHCRNIDILDSAIPMSGHIYSVWVPFSNCFRGSKDNCNIVRIVDLLFGWFEGLEVSGCPSGGKRDKSILVNYAEFPLPIVRIVEDIYIKVTDLVRVYEAMVHRWHPQPLIHYEYEQPPRIWMSPGCSSFHDRDINYFFEGTMKSRHVANLTRIFNV